MRPEAEAVIALSRIPIEPESMSRLRQLVESGPDWAEIQKLTGEWQVEPVVFRNLRTCFAEAVPADILAEFALLERQARAIALGSTLLLVDLIKRFDSAKIPAIVLKGPAVAIAAYGDYSLRTTGDVDLLVSRAALTRARDLLVAQGYKPDYPPGMEQRLIRGQHALEFWNADTKVELHWAMFPRYMCLDFDITQVWNDAWRVPCFDAEIRIMGRPQLFLYLCAHGAKHEWKPLRWICDVAQLAQGLSREEVVQVMALADRMNAKRILALGLRVAAETFGRGESRFPDSAFAPHGDTDSLVALAKAALDAPDVDPQQHVHARRRRIHPYLGTLLFWISSRERMLDKIACGASFFFTPAPGDSGRRFGRTLRPIRLATSAVRRLVFVR